MAKHLVGCRSKLVQVIAWHETITWANVGHHELMSFLYSVKTTENIETV